MKDYYELLQRCLEYKIESQQGKIGRTEKKELPIWLEQKGFTPDEWRQAFKSLYDDGYLTHQTEFDSKLTVSGYLLLQRGGYAKKIEDEKTELCYKNATTFALIFGGVVGGFYYIAELWKMFCP